MDSTTGRHIAGVEHLKQSIADIITTPLGSRLQRYRLTEAGQALVQQERP